MDSKNRASFHNEQEYIHELELQVKSLQSFIDNSEAGMYVADYHTGEVLYANRKTVEMFGYVLTSPKEMFGKTCWDLINPGGGRCPFCPYAELLGENGEPMPPRTWERHFEPYGLWLRIISQAIVWTDGRLAQMNTFYDITEIKRMQEELAEHTREKEYRRMQQTLQEVLDSLPIPVRITDQETAEFMYVNKACVKMFDYAAPEDMLGLRITDVVPSFQRDGTESRKKILELLRSNETTTMEVEYLTSKGASIDGRITACFIDYNGRKSMLGVIQDLAAEQEQRQMLQNAAEKEREANKLKSSFLSNMSHEIRTPMNAIIGLTEIELRKKHSKESSEIYKKINISAKSLLQIVNDILDLSKIEADKLDLYPEEFDLEDVINNALLVASPRLVGKHVELMLETNRSLPEFVIGDKTRLWQMLKNYLDNAAKFTQKGYILLSVEEDSAQSTEDTVYISFVVSDTGIGMSEEQLKKAFLPYEQVYNEAQNRYTGTGLGLPLSKRICELMGGTMKAESILGMGTTICFTLPFIRAKNSETAKDGDLSGMKFLVVDDSELSLRIIGELLKRGGADYLVTQRGKDAIDIAENYRDIDVVLLDYVLEEENGIDIAKSIKKHLKEGAKVLLVTAYGTSIERSELEERGIDEIIEKPFIPSLFYEKILAATGRDRNPEPEVNKYTKFSNARVLVCEDNDINQVVAEGMLAQFGISAVFAGNGKAGIEILENDSLFDLILMDVHMPVMDGYEAARAIRSSQRFNDIPIISLTADAMTEVIDKCIASGMNGYMPKPFEMDDFHDMLLKWLPDDKRIL